MQYNIQFQFHQLYEIIFRTQFIYEYTMYLGILFEIFLKNILDKSLINCVL